MSSQKERKKRNNSIDKLIKKNKAPRSKSDEGVKDMYLENCKILMRQSEESATTKMCHKKDQTLSNKVKRKKEQSWRN